MFNHISDIHSFLFSHESQDGENDGGAEEGGEGVDTADQHGITDNIVMKLVVRSHSQKCSNTHSIREEDLSASINPALASLQDFPVGREQEFESIHGSIQCQGFSAQDGQDDVGEDCRSPNNLEKQKKPWIETTLLQGTLDSAKKSRIKYHIVKSYRIYIADATRY